MEWKRTEFLLAGLDPNTVQKVRPTMQRYAVVRDQERLDRSMSMLAERQVWAGVVLDLDSLGEEAERYLLRLRALPGAPAVLGVARWPGLALSALCERLGVDLLARPVSLEGLRSFVCRAMVESAVPSRRLSRVVLTFARNHCLTPRETQLVIYALADLPREQLRRLLGITENTLKSQVRGLMRKCSFHSLDRLATSLLREALLLPEHHEQVEMPVQVAPVAVSPRSVQGFMGVPVPRSVAEAALLS